MVSKKFKNHRQKWQRMAKLWKEFAKPGRPSKDDIKNYYFFLHSILKNKKFPQIVILGSTPELRELLFKFKKLEANVICFDMDENVYQAMNVFVQHKNKKERFIQSNWLNISQKIRPKSVDAVMGDYVIGNIGGYEDKFFSEIKKILQPNGYFITRAHYKKHTIKKIDNFYNELKRLSKKVKLRKLLIPEASSYFALNIMFQGPLVNSYNKISLSLYTDKLNNVGNKVKYCDNLATKLVFKKFKNSWWRMKDKYWTNYRQDILENKIKKYFQIEKVLYSRDYDIAKISPIYLLKNE